MTAHYLPTKNLRWQGRELQQFHIDLTLKPKHGGEWRPIGRFQEPDAEGRSIVLSAQSLMAINEGKR